MNAYIYNADIYCEPCIKKLIAEIGPNVDEIEDSDSYPQGPNPNGGGEADCPQHCGDCGSFLENPLTAEGYAYVEEQAKQNPNTPVTRNWLEFYDINVSEEDDYYDDDDDEYWWEDYDDDYDDDYDWDDSDEIGDVRADDHDGPISDLVQ